MNNPLPYSAFAEPALLILVSLASGPKHGYAMIEDIQQLYGVRLGPGTLYGAIARLEKHSLITPIPSSDRRRPYRLTAEGQQVLQTQLKQLSTVIHTGLKRLGESPV